MGGRFQSRRRPLRSAYRPPARAKWNSRLAGGGRGDRHRGRHAPHAFRAGDGDRFAGAVVGLGGLGVVTRLTLEVLPTFDMSQVVLNLLLANDTG